MEAANWNGPNIQRTSTRLGLRTEASGRFEKRLAARAGDGRPGARGAADGRAVRRAARSAARSTSAARARRRRRSGCATRASSALLGAAVPRDEQARDPRARSASAWRDADDGLDVTVPALAPQRRHARGRPDRGGRAALGAREAARSRCPRAAARAAGSSPSSGCAAAPRTRSSAPGSPRPSAGASPRPTLVARLRLPADDPRRASCALREPDVRGPVGACARRCSARCSTALRRNRARGHRGRAAVRGRRGLPAHAPRHGARADGRPRPRARPRPPLPDERMHLARAADRPRCGRATWRDPEPPRADFFAAKGVLEALLGALRVPWAVEPAREPFLHPGRAARVLVGGEPAGWLGELHPAVAGALGPRAGRGLRARPRRARAPRRRASRDYEDLTSFPAVRQDLAVVVPDDVPAAELRRGRARGGRRAAARRRGVRRLPRRAGGGGPRVAGAAARVPRARPHADRRGGRAAAREDRRRAAPSSSEGELRG